MATIGQINELIPMSYKYQSPTEKYQAAGLAQNIRIKGQEEEALKEAKQVPITADIQNTYSNLWRISPDIASQYLKDQGYYSTSYNRVNKSSAVLKTGATMLGNGADEFLSKYEANPTSPAAVDYYEAYYENAMNINGAKGLPTPEEYIKDPKKGIESLRTWRGMMYAIKDRASAMDDLIAKAQKQQEITGNVSGDIILPTGRTADQIPTAAPGQSEQQPVSPYYQATPLPMPTSQAPAAVPDKFARSLLGQENIGQVTAQPPSPLEPGVQPTQTAPLIPQQPAIGGPWGQATMVIPGTPVAPAESRLTEKARAARVQEEIAWYKATHPSALVNVNLGAQETQEKQAVGASSVIRMMDETIFKGGTPTRETLLNDPAFANSFGLIKGAAWLGGVLPQPLRGTAEADLYENVQSIVNQLTLSVSKMQMTGMLSDSDVAMIKSATVPNIFNMTVGEAANTLIRLRTVMQDAQDRWDAGVAWNGLPIPEYEKRKRAGSPMKAPSPKGTVSQIKKPKKVWNEKKGVFE